LSYGPNYPFGEKWHSCRHSLGDRPAVFRGPEDVYEQTKTASFFSKKSIPVGISTHPKRRSQFLFGIRKGIRLQEKRAIKHVNPGWNARKKYVGWILVGIYSTSFSSAGRPAFGKGITGSK